MSYDAAMQQPMENVLARHQADARRRLDDAEALVRDGQRQIAEGEQRVKEGQAAVLEARTRLAIVDEVVAELRREAQASDVAVGGAAPSTPPVAQGAPGEFAPSQTNGRRVAMGPVLEDIMSDGRTRTVDEIQQATRERGFDWSRGSILNRCSERVKGGVFVRPDKSTYQLAAASGTTLPSGPASPEGGREPQPESDSQQGAGEVQGAGSLAI